MGVYTLTQIFTDVRAAAAAAKTVLIRLPKSCVGLMAAYTRNQTPDSATTVDIGHYDGTTFQSTSQLFSDAAAAVASSEVKGETYVRLVYEAATAAETTFVFTLNYQMA